MKNKDRIEIQELFMAKAGNDFSRCFYGTIKRLKNKDSSDYCFGKITVNQGYICARADTQEELGRKLDDIVLLVLDYGLHDTSGKALSIVGNTIFLN